MGLDDLVLGRVWILLYKSTLGKKTGLKTTKGKV